MSLKSSPQEIFRPSQETMTEANGDAEASVQPLPIPSVLPPRTENASTPLPILPMLVLSTVMLGEFLSSNVSVPFLIFMVKDFGFSDEADAAFWTGILVAMFFLSQFLTSLIWATLAERYGRRFVLVVALFGSALSVTAFGLSETIGQAICIRLVQGIFAGAVGVARGSVVLITDSSNEGRAYAILGFCWGSGGLLGPIIGGTFERPAERWPVFQQWKVLNRFPYLLPTTLAGLILLAGSFLACFLGRDGGTTATTVLFHPEKSEFHKTTSEEQAPQISNRTLPRNTSSEFIPTASRLESPVPDRSLHYVPISSGIPIGPRTSTVSSSRSNTRSHYATSSRTSGPLQRQAVASLPFFYTDPSENSSASRFYDSHEYQDANDISDTRSIMERVVLANENAVNSIADLWVAAALNAEESNETGTRGLEQTQPDNSEPEIHDLEEGLVGDEHNTRGRVDSRWDDCTLCPAFATRNQRSNNILAASQRRKSRCISATRPMDVSFEVCANVHQVDHITCTTPRQIPSIFMNAGVSTPHSVLDNPIYSQTDLMTDLERELLPILETRQPSAMRLDEQETTPLIGPSPSPSLPLSLIIQFGLLALHTTTHDQVFMSYLVSDYNAGGLSLSAGDFAQLIALMGFAQIVYQFYLYPIIGPPRGRLSHLTMYRLGTFLFIPAYLTVVLYRVPFALPEYSNKLALMSALTISTAVRYCGMTFAFTSISVLLNYKTVGYANGLAQTIVSLARCVGPVLGGWLWSASVEGHPSGYPCGFFVCAVVCTIAVFMTAFIH
ncbi:hypothetical protein F5890DRAFT_817058 [Lentinula detonsa]|uniref:Major facilitator superfamily MFS-1 n=1 Tax=Lentinula detonsa TaxID=2804962 RepID=A0AA38UMI3_9AGAR|nr:hypothetical protein F5890DRAFT_817058 [Lentinula detonsa]